MDTLLRIKEENKITVFSIRNFWSHIDIRGSHWIWMGAVDKDGYGQLQANGVTWKAHRFSYYIFIEEIEEGLLICHTCDITSCVRPDHLFKGTVQDNNRDTVNKGKHNSGSKLGIVLSGESYPRTHLKEKDISEIRNLYSDRILTQKDLSVLYNVAQTTISTIIRGINWTKC